MKMLERHDMVVGLQGHTADLHNDKHGAAKSAQQLFVFFRWSPQLCLRNSATGTAPFQA